MLSQFVDLSELSPEDVAERLTMSGLEVEAIEHAGESLNYCVVGIIKGIKDHPNSAKLKVLEVSVGKEVLQIVCGAPNVRENLKVAVALPGAVLPNGFKVEKADIKGVESYGMLLSEIELGLVDETWGILELEEDAVVGDVLSPYVFMDDVILEVSPTPNRGDCFGVLGVAREVCAIYKKKLKIPAVNIKEEEVETSSFITVEIEDTSGCPRYTARFIDNVKVDESPLWLKVKVKLCGMRPISNVVDVTNYVLMEMGHPLHAFDYDRLKEAKIIVRRAKPGEYIVTLDNEFRELDEEVLVIADAQRPVAIAGIMGGANSEVTSSTTRVLLESAYFDPIRIRKGSKRLSLSTEASKRFERGTDIEMLVYAIDRAAYLIQVLTDAKVTKGIVDVYPRKFEQPRIFLRSERLNFILGTAVPREEISSILEHLDFNVKEKGAGFEVVVPYHRIRDVTREIDLIEEVARIWGFDRIPSDMPSGEIPKHRIPSEQELANRAKNFLCASGFYEVVNYSFINPEFSDKLKLSSDDIRRNVIRLMNPLSEEMSVMRTTLIPGLLDTALRNQRVRVRDFTFFEVGRVFLEEKEALHLALTASGEIYRHWSGKREVDFYDLKGILESFFESFGLSARFIPTKEPFLHPGKSADILINNRIIGFVGLLHPDVKESWDLKGDIFISEISLEEFKGISYVPHFEPIPKFPENTRDLSFIVPKDISFENIYNFIVSKGIKELRKVELIDVYEGPPIEKDKRSMTLSFVFVSPDKTLSDEEVDSIFWDIASDLEKNFPIILRTRRNN